MERGTASAFTIYDVRAMEEGGNMENSRGIIPQAFPACSSHYVPPANAVRPVAIYPLTSQTCSTRQSTSFGHGYQVASVASPPRTAWITTPTAPPVHQSVMGIERLEGSPPPPYTPRGGETGSGEMEQTRRQRARPQPRPSSVALSRRQVRVRQRYVIRRTTTTPKQSFSTRLWENKRRLYAVIVLTVILPLILFLVILGGIGAL